MERLPERSGNAFFTPLFIPRLIGTVISITLPTLRGRSTGDLQNNHPDIWFAMLPE
jgi:hypothetical protein